MSKPSFVNSQECVLFHDYTTGSVRDWSGNGNHGVIEGDVRWVSDGLYFGGGIVRVENDSSLYAASRTFVIEYDQNTEFSSHRDALYKNSDFYLTFRLSDNVYLGDLTTGVTSFRNGLQLWNSNFLALAQEAGVSTEVYLSAKWINIPMNVSISPTESTGNLFIGNVLNAGTSPFYGAIKRVMIFNSARTSTEISQLYSWLNSLTAQSKPYHNLTTLDDKQLFKTGYGSPVSTETMSETLTGTPFKIQSGSFKVVDDEIEGRPVKSIECVTDGAIYIPVDVTQQSKSDAAYGEWICNVYLASSLTPFYWHFIWDDNADTGYYFYIGVNGNVIMRKVESGSTTTLFSTAIGYAPILTNLELRITRSVAGTFTAYINNDIVVAGTGSNPVTDNTNTDSFMQQWGHAAGDKICLGDKNGNYSITKETL